MYNALLQMKQTRTRDLDDLKDKIIQMCAHVITDTVTYIWNLCIDKNYFPKALNKLGLCPFINQEVTKPLQTTDLSQFCLFFQSL